MTLRSRWLGGLVFLSVLAFGCSGCGEKGSQDVAGPEYTIEVVRAGTGSGRVWSPYGGIDCPGSCGPVDWTGGATAPFHATPDSLSVFVGWSGAASGTDTVCSVTVTGHMVLTATFDLR